MKKYLRKFAMAMALLALPATNASAYDLEVGGIFYNIISFDDMTCEVTRDDEGHTRYEGEVVIPGTITYNGRTLTVARIGEEAFRQAPITSITIPSTVTYVGLRVFMDCDKLTKVVIEDGDTPLRFYSSIYTEYPFGEIRCEMFHDCPLNYVYLGRPVFYSTGGDDRYRNLNPFYGNETLREVVVGNSCTEMCDYTFRDCENLEKVTLGNSLVRIGKEAFCGCVIQDVNIPNSVVTIGEYAFGRGNGSGPVSVNLGNSVDTIGNSAFYGGNFSEIRIPNSVRYIGAQAFQHSKLKNIVFGNSVEFIGDYAFSRCNELEEITIPNTVKEFGEYMFQECKSLVKVTIGNSVPSLGRSTFEGCENLEELVIGGAVSTIGKNAFSGCTALSSIYVNNPVPPTGADFENQAYMNAALHVPQGSLADYQAAIGWKDFWSIREFVPNGIEGAVAEEGLRPVIKAAGGLVTVTDAAGTVAVYDMGGALLKEVKAVGGSAVIPLPVGKVYVVKVGDVAEKVAM